MGKSIMFVINHIKYGGAEKMLVFLANELNKRGYNISIYIYEDSNIFYEIEEGINVIIENKISQKRYFRRLIQVLQVRRVIKKMKPDVVISFLNYPNLLSVLATRYTKIPVIISERGNPYEIAKSLIGSISHKIYRFAEGIVFQTDGARDYFEHMINSNSTVIPNPITLKQKYDKNIIRNNEIAFIARFQLEQKRQDIMLKAFKKVALIYPDIKLVFYGDGKDLKVIKNMVTELGLEKNVEFAGVVSNICDVIKPSKMFVLTSDYEGIPNALIEAMSVGLPVISTDCSPGGARLLIKNKVNGLIVPARDIDAISESIIYYLEHPNIAEKYGEKASEIVNIFTPQKNIDLWQKYIEKIIGENNNAKKI